jgi:hypothetical protein
VIALKELVQELPSHVARQPLADSVPPGVVYVDEPDPQFVAPELTAVDGEVEPGTTALVLISAPAAVGKSMLARAIAQETGAVLWNLAAFQVGSNFLAGTVGSSHGFAMTGKVMEAMGSGDFAIVMDGLDEAAIKAGLANLEAFAADVATVLKALRPTRPPVIMFARAETAGLTALILEELELPIAHYSISYFDRQRAEEFLDVKLDLRADRNHRTHRVPFKKAREMLFEKVFAVLGVELGSWDEPEARGFLGYAPALEALAEYLDHTNYAALTNEIEQSLAQAGTAEQQSIWRFLIGIIERVLDREQRKLRENLPEDLLNRIKEAGKLDAVYSPAEQCSRLLAQALGHQQPDTDLPGELRQDYEEAVRQILSEHPFAGAKQNEFANVVFGDYLLARTLVSGPEQYRDGVRASVGEAVFRPSPLLARFMLELTPGDAEGTELSASDFPVLYESLRAEDAASQPVSLSVTEVNETLIAQVVSPTVGHSDLVVKVVDGQALEIFRRLSHAQVVLEQVPLILGRPGEAFTIGPNTSIRAPEIVIRSHDLRVESRGAPDGGVLLAADSFRSEAPEAQIIQHGPQNLELAIPHAVPYPWAQYRVAPLEELAGEEEKLAGALTDLAHLVTWFRSEGFGGLGMYAKPLDAAAAKGRVSKALLDHALERGLITREDKIYYLHPEDIGLALQQVKAKVASEPVRRFLQEFLD